MVGVSVPPARYEPFEGTRSVATEGGVGPGHSDWWVGLRTTFSWWELPPPPSKNDSTPPPPGASYVGGGGDGCGKFRRDIGVVHRPAAAQSAVAAGLALAGQALTELLRNSQYAHHLDLGCGCGCGCGQIPTR